MFSLHTLLTMHGHRNLKLVNATVCVSKQSSRLYKDVPKFLTSYQWKGLYYYRIYLLKFHHRTYTWAAHYRYDLPFNLGFNTQLQNIAIISLLSIKFTGFYNPHNFTNPWPIHIFGYYIILHNFVLMQNEISSIQFLVYCIV